jgi:hypothetical protein
MTKKVWFMQYTGELSCGTWLITPATINGYTVIPALFVVIPAEAGIYKYDWMPDQVRHNKL